MKKYQILFSFLSLLLIPSLFTQAQVAMELVFAESTHDFGTINEVDGPVEFEFSFTNTGTTPIKIENVRASCGCTTPGWSREEVPAGEVGFVKARYNPANRPGPFNKSLTITTNGNTKNYVVYIKGAVTPKPLTIEDEMPTLMGGIRVKYRAFNMGKVLNNEPIVRNFDVYNASEGPIIFLDSLQAPDYIKVEVTPRTLESEMKGMIVVTYDAKAKNDLGYMSDNVVLFTDEEGDESRKTFSVYANIEEYFPPMTPEEFAKAPKLVIEEQIHDFGKIAQGEVVSAEFMLRNDGQSVLNIRKTSSTCNCTVSVLESDNIEPGHGAKLSVTFNSTGRRGTQQKNINIFSNDPKNPTQRIVLKAVIE